MAWLTDIDMKKLLETLEDKISNESVEGLHRDEKAVANEYSSQCEVRQYAWRPANKVLTTLGDMTCYPHDTYASNRMQYQIWGEYVYRNLGIETRKYIVGYQYYLIHYAGDKDDIIHDVVPHHDLYFVTTYSGRQPEIVTFIRRRNRNLEIKLIYFDYYLANVATEMKMLDNKCMTSLCEAISEIPKEEDFLLVRYSPRYMKNIYTIVRYADIDRERPNPRKDLFAYIVINGLTFLSKIMRKSVNCLDLKMALYHIKKSVKYYIDGRNDTFRKFTTSNCVAYLSEKKEQLKKKIAIIDKDICEIQKEARKTRRRSGEEKLRETVEEELVEKRCRKKEQKMRNSTSNQSQCKAKVAVEHECHCKETCLETGSISNSKSKKKGTTKTKDTTNKKQKQQAVRIKLPTKKLSKKQKT